MKKRTYGGTVVQKPSRKMDKKVCDLGRTCPYQEEYQHLMEFCHDSAPAPAPKNTHQRNSQPFTGSGHRLGGLTEVNSYRHVQSVRDDLIRCEICSAKVSLEQLAAHLTLHEEAGKQNLLKREQDSAYEESILLDVQRQSEQEIERLDGLEKKRAAAEKKELEEVLARSILESHKADREHSLKTLLDEPDENYTGNKVVLKFTLPSNRRITRTFRSNNSVQDSFQFLRTQEELEGLQFGLRNAVNTLSLEAAESRSFEQVGVVTNTSLLVVVQEAPEPLLQADSTPQINGETGHTSVRSSANINGSSSSSSTSSSNGSSGSSSNSGGLMQAQGEKKRAVASASEVVDLFDEPPRKVLATSTAGPAVEATVAASSGSRCPPPAAVAVMPAVRTPHRHREAVIDLTLT